MASAGARDVIQACHYGTDTACPSIGSRSELFAEDHAATSRCPQPSNARVRCLGTSYDNYNYTETEPVGVIVHEVRVNTVMPSR